LDVVDRLRGRIPAPDYLGERFANEVRVPELAKDRFDADGYANAKFMAYVGLIRDYSIFFNHTLNSPMPRVRGEAMMCGLATVTTNCHDEDMFIENGVNGFYSNDPAELADMLVELSRDPGLARRIGQRGRERAMEVFHINDYVQEWNRTINDVLGETIVREVRTRPQRYRSAQPVMPGEPSVLFLEGVGGDTERYRVDHFMDGLRSAGARCRKFAFSSPEVLEQLPGLLGEHNVVVFHRVATNWRMAQSILAGLRDRGAVTIFDTDDLVFEQEFPEYFGRLGIDTAGYVELTKSYQAMLEYCGLATCATGYLKQRLEARGIRAHVLRNCFSAEMRRVSLLARRSSRRASGRVYLGYASGTPTHRLDFASIVEPLCKLMKNRKEVHLRIVGHLDLPKPLMKFRERVVQTPFVKWKKLPSVLSTFDVNLAPLVESEAFCQSKSELKWLEAGLVGVPSVCSKTDAFSFAVRDGVDGLIASSHEQWYRAMLALVDDANLRKKMGRAVARRVEADYSPETRGRDALELYRKLLPRGG